MTIRKAVAEDASAVAALDERVTGSGERAAVIRDAVARGRCLIAVEDGVPAGFAITHAHFFGRPFVELLMVDHTHRRQGIGTALLHTCLDACKGDKLFTSTNRSNYPMQALLAKSGFFLCGFVDELDEGDPELIYCLKKEGRHDPSR